MKQPETVSKPVTPFFARKVDNAALVVQTGVRAGLGESKIKARENDEK